MINKQKTSLLVILLTCATISLCYGDKLTGLVPPYTINDGSTRNEQILQRIQEVEAEAAPLVNIVREVLQAGSKLSHRGNCYLIQDLSGQTIALFKPEDERRWGPNFRDPAQRRADSSNEDMYFHGMSSFEQGHTATRQYLSKLLDFGSIATMPAGTIVEIESDAFVDLEAEKNNSPPKVQRKRGYLQAWVSGATSLSNLSTDITSNRYKCENSDLLGQVALDEFQRIGIMDILLYSEDRHAGNVLVTYDEQQNPHLTPIDSDSILPWRPRNLKGIVKHIRASEPFTPDSLRLIDSLDASLVFSMVRTMPLSSQAAVNAKALVLVLKHFALQGHTLNDIRQFVSSSQGPDKPSELEQLMTHASEIAESELTNDDGAKYKHQHHVRWLLWWEGGHQASETDRQWLKDYHQNHKKRVEAAFEKGFWKAFRSLLQMVNVDADRLKEMSSDIL